MIPTIPARASPLVEDDLDGDTRVGAREEGGEGLLPAGRGLDARQVAGRVGVVRLARHEALSGEKGEDTTHNHVQTENHTARRTHHRSAATSRGGGEGRPLFARIECVREPLTLLPWRRYSRASVGSVGGLGWACSSRRAPWASRGERRVPMEVRARSIVGAEVGLGEENAAGRSIGDVSGGDESLSAAGGARSRGKRHLMGIRVQLDA
jgi:hypothetical protein